MKIDWAALASVFGVSLVVTVALVGLFTVGIVALSKLSATAERQRLRRIGRTGAHRRVRLLRGVRGGGRVRHLSDRRLTHPPHSPGPDTPPCVRPDVRLRTLELRRSTAS